MPFSAAAVASGGGGNASALQLEHAGTGVPNTTQCIKKGVRVFDCFSFAFNTSDTTQGSGYNGQWIRYSS
jgi:hypothetical protein